jgi:hypothetical protein
MGTRVSIENNRVPTRKRLLVLAAEWERRYRLQVRANARLRVMLAKARGSGKMTATPKHNESTE